MAVSVHQAAINAAVAFLQTQFDSSVAIHARWPGKDFPGKSITLITAGSRRDNFYDPRVLSNSALGTKSTKAAWQVAECTQPLQLDVWATSHSDRDDILATLDGVLHSGYASIARIINKDPVEAFMAVELADGWEDIASTTAQFQFDQVDYEDSAESINRNQYRATYRGSLFVQLAIQAVTPRQTQINLQNLLDGVNFLTTLNP